MNAIGCAPRGLSWASGGQRAGSAFRFVKRSTTALWAIALVLCFSPRPASADPSTLSIVESAVRPIRDPVAIAARVRGIGIDALISPRLSHETRGGSQRAFWVLDQTENNYKQRLAERRLTSERAYWYVELGQSVDQPDLQVAADRFDRQTYPIVRGQFGSERLPGIDGDPRVVIFVGTVPGVSAYFSSWDEYSQSVFPYSNEAGVINVNVFSTRPGASAFDATLAHEYQHMIHWNANQGDETWVDEGCAELASSIAVPERIVATASFTRQPDVQLTGWSQGAGIGQHYQAAFLFMKYLAARFASSGSLRDLLAQPGRPPDTLNAYLSSVGYDGGFDDVFGDWVVANLIDDPRVDKGQYSYGMPDSRASITARLDLADPPLADTVHQYGADYIELSGVRDGAELVFEGDSNIQLVAAQPTSGRHLWWSNRGDGMDSTMTRGFDLRAAAAATLRFNLWFDTERLFDFVYVLASTDGGSTWSVLRGANATTVNPTGNALGAGYTGKSGVESRGARDEPRWIAETIDLSDYVGREPLIRFEYVTDQAFNARGALVDDIAIPEISFLDDAETDTGWQLGGFVRSDNLIEQRWSLRLVEYARDGAINVHRIPVGSDGRASYGLVGSRAGVERAVLAVSGLTPRTLEVASYRVQLRPPGASQQR